MHNSNSIRIILYSPFLSFGIYEIYVFLNFFRISSDFFKSGKSASVFKRFFNLEKIDTSNVKFYFVLEIFSFIIGTIILQSVIIVVFIIWVDLTLSEQYYLLIILSFIFYL